MGKNATTNHGNQREQPCVWGSSSFLSSLWHLPHPLQKRSPAAGVHGAPKMLVEATHLAAKAVSAAPISPRNARLPPIAQPPLSLSQTTLLWTITLPMSTREAAAATTTQLRPEDGTSVEAQDVETPRHRFSRSPLAQTWKDAAGGDVESSRQLASATLASSITSSALAVPQKTVPCSTLLLTFARIQNPSVIQSLLQRSSGLLDSSTG